MTTPENRQRTAAAMIGAGDLTDLERECLAIGIPPDAVRKLSPAVTGPLAEKISDRARQVAESITALIDAEHPIGIANGELGGDPLRAGFRLAARRVRIRPGNPHRARAALVWLETALNGAASGDVDLAHAALSRAERSLTK